MTGDKNDFYRHLISSWDNPNNVVLDGNEEKGLIWNNDFDSYIDDFSEKLIDSLTYLPDDILTKVDRASMAVSLEVRTPILDHRIIEFSWNLNKNLMLKLKMILRQVLKTTFQKVIMNDLKWVLVFR